MKKRILLVLLIFLATGDVLQAQKLNNIYEDSRKLKSFIDPAAGMLIKADSNKWMPVLKKYVPLKYQTNYNTFVAYFNTNPFDLKGQVLIFQNAGMTADNTPDQTANLQSASSSTAISGSGFGAPVFADALTQVIIKRATEELTATFFVQFKKQLDDNPELQIIFPKTYKFIDHIEPYLYAGFLNTLKQGFLADVNTLPAHLGAFLRSDRVKSFMAKNQKLESAWLTVPVLCFLGDLHQGKSIADCIKDLYPDDELQPISPNYYNVLKAATIVSESVRDSTGNRDWIKFSDFQNNILNDPITKQIFFGLLYESTKEIAVTSNGRTTTINDYIKNNADNITKVTAIIKTFGDGYMSTKNAYDTIRTGSIVGKPLDLSKLLNLINVAVTDVKSTLDAINALTNNQLKLSANTNKFFMIVPQLTEVLININEKKYSSALMNTLIIMDQYVTKSKTELTPFKDQAFLDVTTLNTVNLQQRLDTAISRLNAYALKYKSSIIAKYANSLAEQKTLISNQHPATVPDKLKGLFASISIFQDSFDSNDLYDKLLKYGSFMAAVSEATTTAQVSDVLDAAILPPGSSSIKYYTAFSFSINSYVGGAYFTEQYSSTTNTPSTNLRTLGFALPVGINASMSLRSKAVGSLSLFISAIDLGAIASYRLSDPANVTSSTLPNFTWQNIIAPGGFLVLGRIANTPLALGIGIQKGPQLRTITYNSTDISQDQKFRIGAFLSVDIPLFNLYSTALKKPIKE